MSLSLVLTMKPWFANMLMSTERSPLQVDQDLVNQPSGNADTSTQHLLQILGYCGCHSDTQVNSMIQQAQSFTVKEEKKQYEQSSHRDCSLDSNTKGCVSEKHEIESMSHRQDDDYLLDDHPHSIQYFTNPKTGRKVKKLVCMMEGCSKVFEKKWNFKDHIRMHRGEKPYRCNMCEKAFTQKGNLAKHKRQHEFSDLKSRKIHQ